MAKKPTATKPAKAIKPTRLESGIREIPAKEPEGLDWPAIELDYRAGIKTLRAMAKEHGLSHVAIDKRAKRDGWTRDLNARIRAKAEAMVNKDAVTSPVNKQNETAVVEANATLQADVIRSHRKDVVRARNLVNTLLDELSAICMSAEEIASLEDFESALASGDQDAEAMALSVFLKATGLGDRADIMKKLAETLVKLVTVERVVFGIAADTGTDSVDDRLLRLANEG